MLQLRAENPASPKDSDCAAASLERSRNEPGWSTPPRSGDTTSQLALTAAQYQQARRGGSPGEPSWPPRAPPPPRQHLHGQQCPPETTASGDSSKSPIAAPPGRPPRPTPAPSASPQHRPCSTGGVYGNGHSRGGGGGGEGGGAAFAVRPSTSSSASSSASASSMPAGAAYAAVRAATRATASRQPIAVPQHGNGGGGSSGVAATRPAAKAPAGNGPSGWPGGSNGSTSGGGGGDGGCSGKAGGSGGAGAAGDDVSGLPLEQQVVHYARLGAAAAAEGNAVRAALAMHLLNGCFLRGPSYDRSRELAAAAVTAAPALPVALVEAVAEGAPQSIAAYNLLSYLALAPEVAPQLLSAGLVPVLMGQLRAACSSALEQQLVVSGLGLLLTLARVDVQARGRLAGMRGLAAALAAALGRWALAVRRPALQLVQELILTKKGLEQVRGSTALMAALDRLCEGPRPMTPDPRSGPQQVGFDSDTGHVQQRDCTDLSTGGLPLDLEGAGERRGAQRPSREQQQQQQQLELQLQRQARSVRATIAALAAVMK